MITSFELKYRLIFQAIPWSYQAIDPITGNSYWTGYCLDFAHKLSQLMDFDYEIVIPKNGTFGKKRTGGNWDGVVGDLARGVFII